MKKVLVATVKPFAGEAISGIQRILEDAGYDLHLLEKYESQADLINAIKDVDAMIIRSDIADKQVIDAGQDLKIIVRAGAGYDNIDLVSATDSGIVVMNTPGQNSNAVAELAVGMMILMARNSFDGKSGTELKGKSLGMHAYGNVGKLVSDIAIGLGMKTFAFDPFIDKSVMEDNGVVVFDNIEDLYANCQYVSLHIPANEKTIKSIDYSLLKSMPKGATLVNTARKEVICEESLMKIFNERVDFRYVSDIAPDCKAEIEKDFPGRFFFTPKKMGAQTAEANINAGAAAAKQIVGFFERGDVSFQVNK